MPRNYELWGRQGLHFFFDASLEFHSSIIRDYFKPFAEVPCWPIWNRSHRLLVWNVMKKESTLFYASHRSSSYANSDLSSPYFFLGFQWSRCYLHHSSFLNRPYSISVLYQVGETWLALQIEGLFLYITSPLTSVLGRDKNDALNKMEKIGQVASQICGPVGTTFTTFMAYFSQNRKVGISSMRQQREAHILP